MNAPALTISNIAIGQDAEGRFSLNDLHKAAGGEKRHQPSDWMRVQQTKELIDELRNSLISSEPEIPGTDKIKHLEPVSIIRSFFMTQGTFVVEELVYAYAMWISPAFHLKVIRAYAALVKGEAKAPEATPVTMEQRMDRMESALERMAGHMATLTQVSVQQAAKLDVTARYIGLLEINQKGSVKVTRQIEAQALALSAQGMSKGDIARILRVSRTSVSLLVNGKYPLAHCEAALPPASVEEALESLLESERGALLQRIGGEQ